MTPIKEKFNKEIESLGVLSGISNPLKPAEYDRIKQNILKAISNTSPQEAARSRWVKFIRLVDFVVAAVLGLCLLGGTAFASRNSIPGDLLYPVKLTAEKVELSLAFSEQSKTELQAKFALERIDELQELANRNPRPANTAAPSNSGNGASSSLMNIPADISGTTNASSGSPALALPTKPNLRRDEFINLNAQARANATAQVNLALSALVQEKTKLQAKGNLRAAADISGNTLNLQLRAKAQSLNVDNIGGSTQTNQQNLNKQTGAEPNNFQTQNKNQKYKNTDHK